MLLAVCSPAELLHRAGRVVLAPAGILDHHGLAQGKPFQGLERLVDRGRTRLHLTRVQNDRVDSLRDEGFHLLHLAVGARVR